MIVGMIDNAMETLRRHGIQVQPVGEPWLRLFDVAGRGELTERQLLDLAYTVSHVPQSVPPRSK